MADSAKREKDTRDGEDLVDGVAPGSNRCAEDDSKEQQRVKKLKGNEDNETRPDKTVTGCRPCPLLALPEELTLAIVKEVSACFLCGLSIPLIVYRWE